MGPEAPRVLVAQIGARRRYLVPAALHERGLLERFCTDTYVRSGTAARLLERCGARSLARRRAPSLPDRKVVHFAAASVARRTWRRLADRGVPQARVWIEEARAFGRRVVDAGFARANAAFAYTSAAQEIFDAARANGIATMLDHATAPLVPENDLAAAAWERWPEWFERPGRDAAEDEYFERQKQEWKSADVILCNSEFLRRMVLDAGGPAERCAVVPLGIDTGAVAGGGAPKTGGALRVAFAGDDGLRKGLPDFVEACRMAGIPRGNAIVAGAVAMTAEGRRRAERHATLAGRLDRGEMDRLLAESHALVLPTVSDTFGMAVLEAMAAGCVPIVTPNAGAADVVVDGESGFVVPVHAPERIAEILAMLSSDGDRRAAMGEAARRRAREFGAGRYGERLEGAARAALERNRGC